jgi:hypothetical protein
MEKKYIENRAKNLLTDYWSGNIPVKVDKIAEKLNIVVKKDMLFDSSGIITSDNGEISCKINVMDSEEKHRYSIACAIGYAELNSDNPEDITFDPYKDYKGMDAPNDNTKVWEVVRFAHYLLMPEESVHKEVEKGNKQGISPDFSSLYYSKEFKVPEEAIKERFKELEITN